VRDPAFNWKKRLTRLRFVGRRPP